MSACTSPASTWATTRFLVPAQAQTIGGMGTLFNQPRREDRISEERVIAMGIEIKNVADELDISYQDAINLYLAVAKIDDYDTKDEQLAGLGELFREFIDAYKERNDI